MQSVSQSILDRNRSEATRTTNARIVEPQVRNMFQTIPERVRFEVKLLLFDFCVYCSTRISPTLDLFWS